MRVDEKISERLSQLGYVPQTAAIAYDTFLKSLKPEENILYLMEGSIKNTIGFIVATDLRLYYVGIGRHAQPFLELLDYNDIASIVFQDSHPPSPATKVQVTTKSKHEGFLIKGCDRTQSAEFVELIKLLTQKP
ncbi:MAG: PH domain-containing protein [Cytophagaceae bacterium]|jgi:hypothetical protein|nr:PH domain-containing protein [Cytophagaceae bacterium]